MDTGEDTAHARRWPSVPRALRVRPPFLLAGIIALVALPFLGNPFHTNRFLVDFKGDLYGAGRAILHGENPYQDGAIARLAAERRADSGEVIPIATPVYPAPILLAVTPLSVLPYEVAATIWFLISIVALLVALRLLGVRDIRCLALTFAWMPVLHGLVLGALEPLLVLGVAVAWRWRSSVIVPALAIAAVVVAKLVLWPLGVWLLLTRRSRTFGLAVTVGLVASLVAWAIIGFAGMTAYPRLLSNLSFYEQSDGVSLVAGLLAAGISSTVAHTIAFAVTGGLLIGAWRVAGVPGGEGRAFGLAVVAGLSATAIAWPQYLLLLLVPIALASPTLSAVWFVPLLAWLAPFPRTGGQLPLIVPFLAIEAIVALSLLTGRPGLWRATTPPRVAPTGGGA
jgi:hypothetical protein